MSAAGFKIRRVHVGDLNELRAVWRATGVYSLELEKRFTEFQIISNEKADIVASFGVHAQGKEAHIHTESYAPDAPREEIRELIWKRVQTLAENRGLMRLWADDQDFWKKRGFAKPGEKVLKKGIELFGSTMERRLTLQLREEADIHKLAEAQFELFQQSSQAERERILNRGNLYKNIALAVAALVVLGGLIGTAFFLLSR